jgi:hypothetical protein
MLVALYCFLTNTVSIGFKNTVIMQGAWARATGLWHLDVVFPGTRMFNPESIQSQETFHLIESIPNHEHQTRNVQIQI